jgi:hypothetical protein
MATKRTIKDDDGDDCVIRRLSPNAPRLKSRPRLSAFNREDLVRNLLAEIASGNSMTKLYAALLVQEIISHDPKLARKYRRQLEASQE